MGDLGFLGGRSIISISPFPNPSANEGKTSVIKFKNKICIGNKGDGKFKDAATPTESISAKLHDSRYTTN